jgi:hypothetical protein
MNIGTLLLLGALLLWFLHHGRSWNSQQRHDNAWLDLLAPGIIGLRVWLGKATALFAFPAAPYDDRLFLRQATSLLQGDWLGTYDQLTLAKGPFYSLFWAGSSWAGLSLTTAQVLVYALGCWLLVVALRQQGRGLRTWAQLSILLLLLFCPVLQDTEYLQRAWRQSLWVGVCLLVVATALGLLLNRGRSRRASWTWAAGLGTSLAVAWMTREEAIWLAAPVGLALLLHLLDLAWGRLGWRQAVIPLLALCLAPLLVACVALQNLSHYGYFGIVEFRDSSFLAAYGALSRVEPHDPQRRIPVTRVARQRIEAVSPSFAALRPELEGGIGAIFMRVHEEKTGVPASEREIGAWTMWALRDAAWNTGQGRSHAELSRFYRKVADEVNAAADAGRLPAVAARATMRPVWDWAVHGRRLPASTGAALYQVFNYKVGLAPVPSQGTPADLAWVERLANEPVTPADPAAAASSGHPARRTFWTLTAGTYQHLLRWPILAAALILPLAALVRLRRREAASPATAALVALSALAANVAVVVAVDVSSWDAINIGYLGPSLALGLVPLAAALAWLDTSIVAKRS